MKFESLAVDLDNAKLQSRAALWKTYRKYQGKRVGEGEAAFFRAVHEGPQGPDCLHDFSSKVKKAAYAVSAWDTFDYEDDDCSGALIFEGATVAATPAKLHGLSKMALLGALRRGAL